MNRLQETEHNRPVLYYRKSPISYSIVSWAEYNKAKHALRPKSDMITDSDNGKKYVRNSISWVVKEVRLYLLVLDY